MGTELYLLRQTSLPPTLISSGGGTIVTLTSLRAREERDQARAETLAFVTHELRTPLTSIQGFAEATWPATRLLHHAIRRLEPLSANRSGCWL